MARLLSHMIFVLALLTGVSSEQAERSATSQILMQTSQIAPAPVHHWKSRRCQEEPGGARRSQAELGGARRSQEEPGGARRSPRQTKIRELDSNEQESLLLAENTDAPDSLEVEINLKSLQNEGGLNAKADSDFGPSALLAAFTLGIVALLPDILAFATAMLGFKMVGTVIMTRVFAGDAAKKVEESAESDDDRSGDDCPSLNAASQSRLEATDDFGCTALHMAAHNGLIKQVLQLLDAHADVNACEAWGETPLHMAARAGSTEVCDALTRHGADLDATNADGKTPLILAAQAGNEATCKLLLDRGAGAHGLADKDLPPLLNSILLERLLLESTLAS